MIAAAAPAAGRLATTDDEMTRPPILVAPVTALEAIVADADEEDVGDPQWNVFFGNLHSHSAISDGVESPATAFAHARDVAKVNFLCLSEHNHKTDDAELAQVESAALAASTSSFVAIAGQEFSLLEGGNHINLIDVIKAVPKSDNSNYKKLYTQTIPAYKQANPNRVVVCQFNHPDSISKDYGIAKTTDFPNYNSDFDAFRADADALVSLIAIISGPADSNVPMNAPPLHDQHEEAKSSYLATWKAYLDRGFHLSPTADQDNHRRTWGNRTTARTGVWIKGAFNKQSLLKALAAGRTFATEDQNLRVYLSLNGSPLASRLADPGTAELAIKVSVRDEDEPNSRYAVKLFREIVGDGIVSTDPFLPAQTIKSGEEATFSVLHQAGVVECYYAEVDQTDSNDNAWTAPVWIEPSAGPDEDMGDRISIEMPAGMIFVGSRNSNLYHLPGCRFALQVTPENRMFFAEAPANRSPHDCAVDEHDH